MGQLSETNQTTIYMKCLAGLKIRVSR